MLLGVFPRQPHLSGRQQWRALAVRVPSELHICSLMDKELWLKQFEDDQPTDRLRAIPMLAPKAPCPGNLFLGQGEPGLTQGGSVRGGEHTTPWLLPDRGLLCPVVPHGSQPCPVAGMFGPCLVTWPGMIWAHREGSGTAASLCDVT